MVATADFSGWATKANLKCSDGRTITPDAFKEQDQARVPLVWQHAHNEPANILGYATLEHREDGTYCHGFFNDTPQGQSAKKLVEHGDITALSIYANRLVEKSKSVMHGVIREVSLVLAGANPGARIENVTLTHGDGTEVDLDDEVVISMGMPPVLEHADKPDVVKAADAPADAGLSLKDIYDSIPADKKKGVNLLLGQAAGNASAADVSDEDKATIKASLEGLDEKQTNVVNFMVSEALKHSDDEVDVEDDDTEDEEDDDEEVEHSDEDSTIQDIFDTMSEKQQDAVYYVLSEALKGDSAGDVEHSDSDMDEEEVTAALESLDDDQKSVVHTMIGAALEHAETLAATADDNADDTAAHADDQEGSNMTYNAFEKNKKTEDQGPSLSHDDELAILSAAQRPGNTLKLAMEEHALAHGIENIDILFPDAKAVTTTPDFLARRSEWVAGVMTETTHTPFSRIKSLAANLTLLEARAKGYIKGSFKKEEFFLVSRRITTPQTIYKKQKLDRDDILDITDFDVVAWLKGEMRLMLEEEIARAVLLGDGRSADDEDKILEDRIRPIATDNDFYVTYVNLNLNDAGSSAEEIIDALVLQRRHYRGSGNPTFYTSETILSKLLLVKDTLGRRIYPTVNDVAAAIRVAKIVTVEIMDEPSNDTVGIMVNLSDYTIGADRGGDIAMFDDFDIDYNQQKYLIETRMSGALTKPKSALVVKSVASAATLVTPVAPTWNAANHTVTVPTTTGVVYKNKANGATLSPSTPVTVVEDIDLVVQAVAASSSTFLAGTAQDEFLFTYEDGLVANY
jgi:HK97 family phage prohead protease